MRLAVLNKDKCHPKQCSQECIKYCPGVRAGDETIVMGEDGKPVISEELCTGCGICVHRCPFEAIKIIGLPEELDKDLIHQYGENSFRLFRLPVPIEGKVVGILGENGIGKSTALAILAGNIIPNLGRFDSEPEWDWIIDYYSGREAADYFRKLANGEIKTSLKPQYVDKIPKVYKGRVMDLLAKTTDDTDKLLSLVEKAGIAHILDREISKLSGGELQLVAIVAAMAKDADFYFFDEPSSYLDIQQRLLAARMISTLAKEKLVMIVEHDLALLDFMADVVYLMYGEPSAYGIVANPRGTRVAINTYLDGYLREENIRFRDFRIEFFEHPPKAEWTSEIMFTYPPLRKTFRTFHMEAEGGTVHEGEVIGIVGPNATGKTTFVRILAGEIEHDAGKLDIPDLKLSYKPQYIKIEDFYGTVYDLFMTEIGEKGMRESFYKSEIEHPLRIKDLYHSYVSDLSGGELQRVAIALALARDADIYLLDEPSAYLDSNQRMIVAKTIRRVMEKGRACAMVVDHDVYFLDLIADSIIVFEGERGRYGKASRPHDMHTGMNLFLKNQDITFRRDPDTKRPRINKPGSYLDRKQREMGEYYYAVVTPAEMEGDQSG